jgi:NADPH2:quinone reductase
MRAWQVVKFGEPQEALRRVEAELPEPPPGLLRVRVSACALGLPDLLMCRGSYALTPELPFTPGQELVGKVTAVGEGARFRVGDRIMAVSAFFLKRGGFAREALALDDFAFPAPDDMEDAEAAGFVIPYHTAYVGLVRRAALQAGETLLVLGGAGGTGSAAIQLGRALGAKVVATAGGVDKAAFCRELGADRVIDYRSDDLAGVVRDATGGRGADVVYDTVGGDIFQAATQCIAHEGRLLVVGFASGGWGRPSAAHMATHNYSVMGVIPSGYDNDFRDRAQQELLEQRRRGAIRAVVDRVFPFESLPEGLEQLAAGRVRGKLVLEGDL